MRLCAPWASRSDPSGLCRAEPSEIPSKTQSVSAFLPRRVSVCPRSSGNSAHSRMAPFAVLAVTRASVIRTQAPAICRKEGFELPKAPTDLKEYREKFFARLQQSLVRIQEAASNGTTSLTAALKAVEHLKPLSEHVNQAHHEALCLAALEWLRLKHDCLVWFWQPTNTGNKDEADVEGRDNEGNVIVAAECSASIAAKGTLRDRMNSTLEKLDKLSAKHRYYFVVNEDMRSSAENRMNKYGHDIVVQRLTIA